MPQPPNLQKMLAEAQAMLAAQQEAQEKLKEQKVEASAGGGMVKVAMTGDLRLESLVIDPDAVDPEDVEMLQDMVVAAVNEALRMAEQLQQSELGGAEQGGFDPMSALESLGLGGMGGLGRRRRRRAPASRRRRRRQPRRAPREQEALALARPAPPAARHRAVEAAGDRQPHRAAARLPRAARLRRRRARAGAGDHRRQGEDHALRDLLQPRRGPALHDLPRRAPRPERDLRGRGAQRRDPDRAHARVPRPLPRARRRALADRRRRARGPAARPALRAAWSTASARSSSPPTRRRPARPPRCTSPASCTSAPPTSSSPAWPPACRSAATSSTPTRSRSAARSPGRRAL